MRLYKYALHWNMLIIVWSKINTNSWCPNLRRYTSKKLQFTMLYFFNFSWQNRSSTQTKLIASGISRNVISIVIDWNFICIVIISDITAYKILFILDVIFILICCKISNNIRKTIRSSYVVDCFTHHVCFDLILMRFISISAVIP